MMTVEVWVQPYGFQSHGGPRKDIKALVYLTDGENWVKLPGWDNLYTPEAHLGKALTTARDIAKLLGQDKLVVYRAVYKELPGQRHVAPYARKRDYKRGRRVKTFTLPKIEDYRVSGTILSKLFEEVRGR